MRRLVFIFSIGVLLWGLLLQARENPGKSDIFLVLDNSGSMKTNDPDFLTREVVSNFLKGIDENTRLGMVIFDQAALLVQSLTPVIDETSRENFLKCLEKVNYQGQWTNIPAAVERALYELKSNGRNDAEKIIIFLTDGIVDTGDKNQDVDKTRWLREELTEDSKKSGVRIFGIAFTEQADFSLIQALALKTDGQYFRAFKAEDIQGVFIKIDEAIKKLKSQEKTKDIPGLSSTAIEPEPASPVQPAKKGGLPVPLPIIVGVFTVLLLAVILILARKKPGPTEKIRSDAAMPEAKLTDEQQVISSQPIEIRKPLVTIGRDPNTDITIPQDTVSALHATIKYENHAFYLEDQRSSNFTRLNNEKIAPNKPVILKSGDVITFDVYHFRFILPQMIPAGGTVLKKDRGTAAAGTPDKKPVPPEPPEAVTLPKPKPGTQDEPPEMKTLAKPGPGPK